MSLVQDIADYIASETSFVIDTDLFIGGETVDTPSGSIIIREFAGSIRNESGLESRAIQILSLDRGYINAETLINECFNLLANMPGFASHDFNNKVFFVGVINMPGFIDRDKSGNYVFSANLLFNISSALDSFIDGIGGIPVGYPILNQLIDDVAEISADLDSDEYMKTDDYDVNIDKVVDEAESIDGGTF